MTTTIYLIRHGQTESNVAGYHMGWSDEDLSAVGYAQAESLALRLAQVPLTAVYTSSSKRAFATAAIIAKPHGLEPKPMPELREINYGEWEGQKRAEMRDKYPEISRQLRVDPSNIAIPGGESFTQVVERVMRAYNTIVAAEQDKCVAIVSHSFPLRVMITHILGAGYGIWGRFELGNVSISEVQIADGIPRLITLNDRTHLEIYSSNQ